MTNPLVDENGDPLICLSEEGGLGHACEGPVEYRMALSGTGISYPRCDYHWQKRLEEQERLNVDYPDSPIPPAWFHDCGGGVNEYGERWDDDY